MSMRVSYDRTRLRFVSARRLYASGIFDTAVTMGAGNSSEVGISATASSALSGANAAIAELTFVPLRAGRTTLGGVIDALG